VVLLKLLFNIIICVIVIAVPAAISAAEPQPSGPPPQGVSLDLQASIDRAIETHPSIAAARANARAAGADVKAARWQRFASFSVEGLFLDQPGNSVQAQVVVDQPLWTNGRIEGSIDRAKARENAALAAYQDAALTIALSTAQAFFEVWRWRDRLVVLTESFEQHERMVASMERRYAQDVSPLSDLELARSRALQIEQQLYLARSQEGAALDRWRELVGDPILVPEEPQIAPQVWPRFDDTTFISQALAFSPLIKRLRFEAIAASAEARVARASILPAISGQYSYSDTFRHRVGVVIRTQSDGGLSRFAAAEAARARVNASELQVAAAERQLRGQVFSLLREYEAATSRLDGNMMASASARRVMESYMRQFASGRRTWLDLMNAVRESTSAKIDTSETLTSSQSALARLLLLSGDWTRTSEEAQQ
jgi:adhesin transport system outer membrane protein